MDSRRDFLKKSLVLTGAAGLMNVLPTAIQRALAIDPAPGSTYLDAEHVVIVMQENRSFDHCFGSLQGVRGFGDPRPVALPNKNPVWLQSDAEGKTYAPFRLDMKGTKGTWMGDLPHSRHSQVDALNEGKYDKWLDFKRSRHPAGKEMPLTLGFYNREDLPFHYAMADAFTVCDHNFCSSITSTTPNRSYFWTGNIVSEENGLTKMNIRNPDYKAGKQRWETFPELLEKHRISWKFYQNEISTGGGFSGAERSWLSNFGCNLLEYFEAYHVKYSKGYIRSLEQQLTQLPAELKELRDKLGALDPEAAAKARRAIAAKEEVLEQARQELARFNDEAFNRLPEDKKRLFRNAFTTNEKDPDYRTLTKLLVADGGTQRELAVPKGDLFYQFREDVKQQQLPAVSWFAAPQNFSDHPSAPWYGAWYISEILDILTSNPEVWKKTILIMTYDENDGYYDHLPPFVAPDARRPGTGKCSPGIDTELEWVRKENELRQGIPENEAREAPIGLGFRVPMIIASPWSRGGNVNSQVFDHTSTLRFLEMFIRGKWGKDIRMNTISEWRRTICGDLTSAFKPFAPEEEKLSFLDRDEFVGTIFNAQFRKEPTGFRELTPADIAAIREDPLDSPLLPQQEKGVRTSNGLPYELYAGGGLSADRKSFEIQFKAGDEFFGKEAAGSPFTVYALERHATADEKSFESGRVWSYAVKPGDVLTDQWPLTSFEKGSYHLQVRGPNGFMREFKGSELDPRLRIDCGYTTGRLNKKRPDGNIFLRFTATGEAMTVTVTDNAYRQPAVVRVIPAGKTGDVTLDLRNSYEWYDFTVNVNGYAAFEQRFAGRAETGQPGYSDPLIGRAVR